MESLHVLADMTRILPDVFLCTEQNEECPLSKKQSESAEESDRQCCFPDSNDRWGWRLACPGWEGVTLQF